MEQYEDFLNNYKWDHKEFIKWILLSYDSIIASYEMTEMEFEHFKNKNYLMVARDQSNHVIDLLQDELIQLWFMKMEDHWKLNIK